MPRVRLRTRALLLRLPRLEKEHPIPLEQRVEQLLFVAWCALTKYSSTESWMKVVDCTMGVRIAPVSLFGLMPSWTSLLPCRVHRHRHHCRKRDRERMRERERARESVELSCAPLSQDPVKRFNVEISKLNTRHAYTRDLRLSGPKNLPPFQRTHRPHLRFQSHLLAFRPCSATP